MEAPLLFLHWPFNTLGPQIHKPFLYLQEIFKKTQPQEVAYDKKEYLS